MDAADHGNQTANVNGDGNSVFIAKGDMHISFPQPVNGLTSALARDPKPRRLGWWLSSSAVALALTGLIANSPVFRPGQPAPVAATAQMASIPVLSPSTSASNPRSPKPADTPGRSRTVAGAPSRSSSTAENRRPSPPATWPDGKSAMCKDGWFSESQRRSGTCSGHDGVAHWRYPEDHPYWQRA